MWRLWRLFILREAMKTPVDSIIRMVAEHYKWTPEEILGKRGIKPITDARFMAVWLIREHLGFSWHAIARCMNQKQHGSAMNAYEQMKYRMEVDPVLRKEGAELLAQLTPRTTSEG